MLDKLIINHYLVSSLILYNNKNKAIMAYLGSDNCIREYFSYTIFNITMYCILSKFF